MNDSEKIRARAHVERYVWILAVVWTVIIAASLVWNVIQVRRNTLEAARIQARAAFEKDVIYRRWNAEHGGVYALVTEETRPNPYLKVSERDVMTPLRKPLTLINPAYMTRQVHELAEEKYGVRGHITSLNPIRPDNAPDPWETEALRAFERGKTEDSSVEKMEGEGYMRLMRPLITEKGCLKCHAAQGYQEGDIRGGISVSVPLEPLWAISRMHVLTLVLGHVLLWLMGLVGVVLGTRRLRWSERERNRAAEALQKAKEKAEAANRAKSVFLANMSHELRTPLNAVLGFSQLMQQNPETSPSQREDLEIINRSGQHLLALINDVLDMSKIEAGRIALKIEPFDLGELVRDVMDMMHRRAEGRGLQLILDQSSDFPRYVEADSAKLRQILINLLSNAVKYTEEGGVTIRLGATPAYGSKAPNLQSSIFNLQFEVEDTGIGITKQDLEHIFQPFEQLGIHPKQGGTGLGLALTKQFVEMMDGEIGVESTVGKGSLFYVEIPVRRVDEDKIAQVEPSRGRVVGLESGQPGYRILIVEDQQDSRLLLKKLLEPVGFAVREAVNGEEAVHVFQEWKPHFIWMDRRMPVMDGLEATRRIKAIEGGKETVIVALTASVMEEQRNEVLAAGCDDFLRKPFREAEIFKTMAKHLGVRYLYAEEPTEPAAPEAKIEPGRIADSLAALSPETLSELKKSVEEIDLEATQRIIERISERDRALAEALGGLLKNFRFDILQELTKEVKQ